ncbi:MAG TPA: FlgD immunoglobulin-like domain containing protein, partial [candidate division Zixibacteria bacterium]|nr:FlgD immunoglobulin-like domain containing protein [candidate division Zixibacteria bacterium]
VSNVAAIGAAAGMDVKWNVMDGQLRILLFKIGKAAIPAGPQELVSVALEGSGELLLARAEVVDYQGQAYSVAATGGVLPSEFVLDQNFPNPFNPSTVISFALANTADWTLAIYNVNGALVREYHGSDAGRVQVEWDGRAADGSRVASGVYLYRLEAGEFNDTKKMILLK